MSKRTYEQELEENGSLIYVTKGNSMRPFIRSGEDLVEIRARGAERLGKYDVVLYRRAGGKYVLHRIVKVRETDYVLCGDNCAELEPGITDGQILGVLTGIIRNGQRLDTNTPAYQRRVRLWVALYGPRAVILKMRRILGKLWRTLNGKAN